MLVPYEVSPNRSCMPVEKKRAFHGLKFSFIFIEFWYNLFIRVLTTWALHGVKTEIFCLQYNKVYNKLSHEEA